MLSHCEFQSYDSASVIQKDPLPYFLGFIIGLFVSGVSFSVFARAYGGAGL